MEQKTEDTKTKNIETGTLKKPMDKTNTGSTLREGPPKWYISSRRESLPRSECDIAEVTSGSVAVVTYGSHSKVTLHMFVEDT